MNVKRKDRPAPERVSSLKNYGPTLQSRTRDHKQTGEKEEDSETNLTIVLESANTGWTFIAEALEETALALRGPHRVLLLGHQEDNRLGK